MVIDFRFSVVRQKTGSGQVGIGPVHFQLVLSFVSPGNQGVKLFIPYRINPFLSVEESFDNALHTAWEYLEWKYGVQHFIGKEAVAPHCRFFHAQEKTNNMLFCVQFQFVIAVIAQSQQFQRQRRCIKRIWLYWLAGRTKGTRCWA